MRSQEGIRETLKNRGASTELVKLAEKAITFVEDNLVLEYEPDFCTMNGEHQISFSSKNQSCFAEIAGLGKSNCIMRVHKKEFTLGMQETQVEDQAARMFRFKGSHCCFEPRVVVYPNETDLKAMLEWFKEGE